MPLTDTTVRNAKPKEKPYKLYDEKGLFILISPSGGKWWRMDYTFQGKRKTISLGTYPEVGLREAREKRDELRKVIVQGVDPSLEKKKRAGDELTFGELAWQWFEVKKPTWAERHAETVKERIKNYIEPYLGQRKVQEITAPEIFSMLLSIQDRGYIELARRLKQIISMIFRFGIVKGSVNYDPAASLGRGVLATPRPKHYPTILDPEKIGALIRAIDGYEFTLVRCALKLLALTFVRPGELRHAEWSEIRFNEKMWEIPLEKTKTKKEHLVPLSRQAVETLLTVQTYTGRRRYVFSSFTHSERPISDATLNAALRRMGFDTKNDITSHGFRAMARTILHERLGYQPDVVEIQLGHTVPDRLGEAYNRAKFLDERKRMMQDWADYLDSLKNLKG